MTTRREFIMLAVGASAAWPVTLNAQQPSVPIIGFLHSGSPGPFASALIAFRQGLIEAGYVEGQNVVIEYRWAQGQYDRLPVLVADLIGRQVNVIVAIAGNAPAQAAKSATATIPIVFVSGGDPVSGGLITSFNRPSGNVTGVSWFATELVPKQLEVLRRLVGNPAVIGALMNPRYPDHDLQARVLQKAGAEIEQTTYIAEANTEQGIATAFELLARQRAGALIVANDPFFIDRREQIVALAAHHKLPAMYFSREFTSKGGLLSYGASLVDAAHQGGLYTGKILKGAKPADLPVLQPTKFDLVINLKTATALGLHVPPSSARACRRGNRMMRDGALAVSIRCQNAG